MLMEQTRYNLWFRWFIVSGEHYSVDGTLIQAWAGQKSSTPSADTQTSANDFAADR